MTADYRERHYIEANKDEIRELHARGLDSEEIIAIIEGPDCPEIYARSAVEVVLAGLV